MCEPLSIAVLLTCFNRKKKTIKCLQLVNDQNLSNDINLDIILVDDGSTDGTSDAVKKAYPNVDIIKGDGSLFWNGGMRLAFRKAMDKRYDYYLWLNDDTALFIDTIGRLINLSKKIGDNSIVIGSVKDPVSNQHTYGGIRQVSKFKPLKFEAIVPDKVEPIKCDTFNGNCVLIPNAVALRVGNLSSVYTHGIGDFDYGLRAKKMKIKSFVPSGYYGVCDRNPVVGCFDRNKPLVERLRILHSPKGIPPKEWMYFARRHAPYLWPFYLLKLYVNVLFP